MRVVRIPPNTMTEAVARALNNFCYQSAYEITKTLDCSEMQYTSLNTLKVILALFEHKQKIVERRKMRTRHRPEFNRVVPTYSCSSEYKLRDDVILKFEGKC